MLTIIGKFTGEYRFLSNFYKAGIRFGRYTYPTAEHLYQYLKTTPGSNWESYFRMNENPADAKKIGGSILIPPYWDRYRRCHMRMVLRLKFEDKYLAKRLKSTGEATLVEGNTWHDNYWGNCTCAECTKITGGNTLGKLLMELRANLSKKKGV